MRPSKFATASRRRSTGPDDDTVITVLIRARRAEAWRACCEVCGDPLKGERGMGWSIQHRRGRDGERTDNRVTNLLAVCGGDNVTGCHGRIHSRRSEAEPAGWTISRIPKLGGGKPDPAGIPVLIDNGARVVYLTEAGGYADNPPDGAP